MHSQDCGKNDRNLTPDKPKENGAAGEESHPPIRLSSEDFLFKKTLIRHMH
jgi:hypothetical protein